MLTGYSKMKLAVQVLSRTVSTCVFESGDPEVVGTAIFCQMINDSFDCSNVRSRREYQFKKNQQVKPYSSADDEWFVWMSETFLTYLKDWQASIVGREGDFSATAQGKMFLSHQTYESFEISVHSHLKQSNSSFCTV